MDLSTIENMLNNNKFISNDNKFDTQHFYDTVFYYYFLQVDLIFSNCQLYNSSDSVIYKHSVILRDYFDKLYDECIVKGFHVFNKYINLGSKRFLELYI